MKSHVRYYIVRENQANGKLFRTQTGSWSKNFEDAQLWCDSVHVEKKAIQLRRQYLRWAVGFASPIPHIEIEVITVGRVQIQPLGV